MAIDEQIVDNTGVTEFYMINNECADLNVTDSSPSRAVMRDQLRSCFEIFNDFFSTTLLSCNYTNSGNYTCNLSIDNPEGLNNFTRIDGNHLPDLSNDDVLHVIRTTSSITKNVPSIICERFKNLQTINLQSIGIETINEYSFKSCQNVIRISIRDNKITRVDDKSFDSNLLLKELWLYNNLISSIAENLFDKLENLEILRLQNNSFTDFPANTFKSLKNLDSLSISANKISTLRMEWFESLGKLTTLWIYENLIEDFPKNIFTPLKNLVSFISHTNKLSVIHADSFGNLPKLRTLSFEFNQITAIDEQIIDNTGVTGFYMMNNECADLNVTDSSPSRAAMRDQLRPCFEIFNDFFSTTLLTCIYTNSGNYTCNLSIDNPEGLNNFTRIDGNHLSDLSNDDVLHVIRITPSITKNVPSIICERFKNLQTINLQSLGIEIINEYSFKSCQKLARIGAWDNKISRIEDKSFDSNLLLKELWLYNNLISSIAENLFDKLENLELLRLHGNNFTDFPANIFKSLKNLNSLSINENKISTLRMEWFESLGKLTILWIYENLIEDFPKNIFSPMTSLSSLYAHTNKLTVLNSESFGNLPALRRLSFESNQIMAIDERIIDKTNVTDFYMLNNLCANAFIIDSSPLREVMRSQLRQCFENYNDLFSTTLLNCNYTNSANYTCNLSLDNPNGLNNFTRIGGDHLQELNNDDVLNVIRTSSSVSKNVPSIICEKFKNVQRITLERIGIETINENSFKGCENLFYISLTFNKISEIEDNSFVNNLKLQELWLHDNLISSLAENIFENLGDLRALRLQGNKFTDFPANTFKSLNKLNTLSFSRNQISNLRIEWFESLELLRTLWIYENPIENYQKNIFVPLKSLTEFYAQTKKLQIIHADSFGIHPNLKIISFASNQIMAIDEQIIDKTNVTDFDMLNNLCANATIIDSSPSREVMRSQLRQCFENYINLYTTTVRTTVTRTTTTRTTTSENPTPPATPAQTTPMPTSTFTNEPSTTTDYRTTSERTTTRGIPTPPATPERTTYRVTQASIINKRDRRMNYDDDDDDDDDKS